MKTRLGVIMSKRSLEDVYDPDLRTNMNGLSSADGAMGSEAELKKAKLDESGYSHGDGLANGGSNGTLNGSGHVHAHGAANGGPHGHSGNHGTGTTPSKVVHIRGVPADCVEADIVALGLAFGRINNVLILKGKNQAFLEMVDEVSAIQMVNYYNSGFPCMVKNKQCFVQHSTHKELKTDQNHMANHVNSAASLMKSMPMSMMMGPSLGLNMGMGGMSPLLAGLHAGNGGQMNGGQDAYGGINTILRVVVENMMYPIPIDILHGIFSRFGKVLRIITFTKNQQFQALIQYPDRQSASLAKQSLDGQNIYAGCCTLRIEYSRLENLRVTFNNDKSRDYTNPNLPSGDATVLPDLHMSGFNPAGLGISSHSLLHGLTSPHGMSPLPTGNPYHSLLHAGLAANSLNAALGGMGRMNGGASVVLVSNINEELVTPEILFILFGVYGDVLRVKILFNKKDTALIQYAEPRQAQLAILHLDRVRLFGKALKVTNSKHSEVQLPKESQPDCGLTRDFASSPLHRFKKPGSKNYLNIYPPAMTLHLSNLPPNVTEENVVHYFAQNGFTVKHFRFFPKDHKMALVQLGSVDEAVEALVKMHNFQLNENTHLRVSFSKATIKE